MNIRLVFLIFFVACDTAAPLSFKDTLEHCKEQSSLHDGMGFVSPNCVIGSQFPIIEGYTIDDKKIGKEYFENKICIINFWFEGCKPCVAEIPGFNRIVQKYGDKNIRYLAISRDTKEDVKSFLKSHPWEFDHLADGSDLINKNLKLPWGYPTTFVVDGKGVIAKAICGGFSDSTAVANIQLEICPVLDSLLGKMK